MYPPVPGSDIAERENRFAEKLGDQERAMQARLSYFNMRSSGASSGEIAGFVSELQAFWASFDADRPVADQLSQYGRPACAQKLEALIQRAADNINTYQYTYNSRFAYEQAMGRPQPQPQPPVAPSLPRSGPRWFNAVMGWNCYWCEGDLRPFPSPLAICPYCHGIPLPPPS